MSGNPSDETRLTNKHFEFDVEVEDPKTGFVSTFPMEIDTGNPIALAMPRSWSHFFTRQLGTVDLGGAGSAQSPAFDAKIKKIGNIDVNFPTMAVMTLTDSQTYGLIGMEFLKYMRTEIYDKPSDKRLKIENTHL